MSDIPVHVGYILDGNRRWAREHGLPKYEGHLAGYNALQAIVEATFKLGVKYVSAYAFSTENWKRSEDEVNKLMGLVLRMLTSDLHIFTDNNIKLRVIGSRENVKEKIVNAIERAEELTADNTDGELIICFNYGGPEEIAQAAQQVIDAHDFSGLITPEAIEHYLYAPDVPPCDLIVRTSGERRLSGFMLWRASYAELLFLDKNWPDMKPEDAQAAVEEYTRRKRRFGA